MNLNLTFDQRMSRNMDLETSLLALNSLLAIIFKVNLSRILQESNIYSCNCSATQIANKMSSRENSNLCGGGGDHLEEDLIFENLMAVKHMLLDVMETQDHANISGMFAYNFRIFPVGPITGYSK